MTSDWSPSQYHRFRDERSRPFHDLLALVRPSPGMRVVDLGCGTGELTRLMHHRLAASETIGIDNSAAMLGAAAANACPGLRFEPTPIEAFADAQGLDLVFSNAALQWVDDHESLFPRLAALVRPGGQFAVQMPANHEHPSHLTARAVAAEPEFRDVLMSGGRMSPLLSPAAYASMLHRLGFREQVVRIDVYGHELASREEVVEWVRGTLLTWYEKRLGAPRFARFLALYRDRLMGVMPDDRPYFYAFPRLLMWGRRGEI